MNASNKGTVKAIAPCSGAYGIPLLIRLSRGDTLFIIRGGASFKNA
jgi:hypothetical protein